MKPQELKPFYLHFKSLLIDQEYMNDRR